MILAILSILISIGMIGFAVREGRQRFQKIRQEDEAIAALTQDLLPCAEGHSFLQVLNQWSAEPSSMASQLASRLLRLCRKSPIRLRDRLGWLVDLDHVVDSKRLTKQLPGYDLISTMPGLLTGLGILFTFLGLTIGVIGLDPTDGDQLTQGVRRLLGGMSMAFLTSLCGIGSGLAWTWLSKKKITGFEEQIRQLHQKLLEKPYLLLPDESAEMFLHYQQRQTDALDNLEKSMSNAFRKVLQEEGWSELRQSLMRFSENQAVPPISEPLEALQKELSRLNVRSGQAIEQQKLIAQAIEKLAVAGGRGGVPMTSDGHSKLLADTQNVLVSFGSIHKAQDTALKSVADSAKVLRQMMADAKLASQDTQLAHQQLSAHMERLEKHWEHYRNQIRSLQNHLEKTIEGFQGKLQESLDQTHDKVDGLLAKSLKHFLGAMQELQATLNGLAILQQKGDDKKSNWFGKKS